MAKLCVQIITYNEEKNIRECLESVSWANEVLIVDSFSTDNTLNICGDFSNIRILQHKWEGYAAQRNYGLSQTDTDWILILDADERITSELKDEILKVISNSMTIEDGFFIYRKTFIGKLWLREIPYDDLLRLFRREKGRYAERTVHETVIMDGKIGRLKNPMDHFCCNGIINLVQKWTIYAELNAIEMLKNGKKSSLSKLIIHPIICFIKLYLGRQRFRSGMLGFITSISHSFYTFLKYARLWELQKHPDQ